LGKVEKLFTILKKTLGGGRVFLEGVLREREKKTYGGRKISRSARKRESIDHGKQTEPFFPHEKVYHEGGKSRQVAGARGVIHPFHR